MGEPKFSRKKYSSPSILWDEQRIKEEKELQIKYGLKNKREVWKAKSLLRNFRRHARELVARLRTGEKQAEREKEQLLKKLIRLGILTENSGLDDVLALDVNAILSRRLQTLVYLKGLAYTPWQARQLIVHGHTAINGRKVNVPSYLVRKDEENSISYYALSPLSNELHPSRPKLDENRVFQRQKNFTEKREE